MVLGKLDSDMQKNELDHFLTPNTKIHSKWMKDLNIKQEAIKILEEKAGKNLFDLGRSNFLLNMSLEIRETKAKLNYWDLIKVKSFCTMKETDANDISDKELVSKIYKELTKLNTQKQIIQ